MFDLFTYATVVHKDMIIEGESEQYNKNKESKKRKAEFQGGIQGQGSTQIQFTKKDGFQ